jgi:hypothetical protein
MRPCENSCSLILDRTGAHRSNPSGLPSTFPLLLARSGKSLLVLHLHYTTPYLGTITNEAKKDVELKTARTWDH